jgi:hypothetical protein
MEGIVSRISGETATEKFRLATENQAFYRPI